MIYLNYVIMWSAIYYLIEKNNSLTNNYNSYIVAFIHSVIAVILYSINFIYYEYDKEWDSSLNILSIHSISISIGYFIYDLYHVYLINYNKMFIKHHLLSIGTLILTYYLNIGSKIITLMILLGELSNPFQTSWYLARKLNYEKIEKILFPLYCFPFIIIRTAITPYILISILYHHHTNIYILLICSVFFLGLYGSLFWTKKLISICYNRYIII